MSLILLISCVNTSNEEYFCEERTDISTNNYGTQIFYQQSAVLINNTMFCHNYSSEIECGNFDQITQGQDKFDTQNIYDEKVTESTYYKSTRLSENKYQLDIFKKYKIKDYANVSKKLINGRWHFYVGDFESNYTLPVKDATNVTDRLMDPNRDHLMDPVWDRLMAPF